jgi:hypothetical protein
MTIRVTREKAGGDLEQGKQIARELAGSAGYEVGDPDSWTPVDDPVPGWEFAWTPTR